MYLQARVHDNHLTKPNNFIEDPIDIPGDFDQQLKKIRHQKLNKDIKEIQHDSQQEETPENLGDSNPASPLLDLKVK